MSLNPYAEIFSAGTASLLIAVAALPFVVRSLIMSVAAPGKARFVSAEGLVGICAAALIAQSAGAIDLRSMSMRETYRYAERLPAGFDSARRISQSGFREAAHIFRRISR